MVGLAVGSDLNCSSWLEHLYVTSLCGLGFLTKRWLGSKEGGTLKSRSPAGVVSSLRTCPQVSASFTQHPLNSGQSQNHARIPGGRKEMPALALEEHLGLEMWLWPCLENTVGHSRTVREWQKPCWTALQREEAITGECRGTSGLGLVERRVASLQTGNVLAGEEGIGNSGARKTNGQ